MISRLYFSRAKKAVALFTSMLFILAVFPGCAESSKVPTKQADSSTPKPSARESGIVSSPKEYEPAEFGEEFQSVETSIPRPKKESSVDGGENLTLEAVPLSEAERSGLIAKALSMPDGQSIQSSLISLGYQLRSDLAIGARKTMQPDSGAVTVIIPFGTTSDSTRAAFVNYSKIGTDVGFGAFMTVTQIDSPTVASYEKMAPQLWLLIDSDDGPVFPSAIDEAGKNFG